MKKEDLLPKGENGEFVIDRGLDVGYHTGAEKSFTVYKADDDHRLVFGWASVAVTVTGEELEDRQHDIIDPEDLEDAAYEYVLNFRDTGEEHLPGYRKKGKLVESCVLTKEKQRAMGIPDGVIPVGWWIGFKIDDEDTWNRVKNGTYKMFSIEGKATREPVQKSARTFEDVVERRRVPEYDEIDDGPVTKRFDYLVEVEKFNMYHGPDGRFASANGAASVTAITNSPAGKKTILGAKVEGMTDLVKGRLSNDVKPFKKEGAVNIEKVKERSGLNDEDAKRCVDAAEKVYRKAAEVEPQITEDVIGAVAGQGGKMYGLDFRMKQPTSMAGKIGSDAKDDNVSFETAASNIKDAVRYTAVIDEKNFTSGYNHIKSELEAKGYKESRCKNFYEMYEKGESCQKAVQCVYENKDGYKFELQFHTPHSQGAKELNHPLYEEQRAKTTSKARQKELNDIMTEIGSHVNNPDGVMTIKSHK